MPLISTQICDRPFILHGVAGVHRSVIKIEQHINAETGPNAFQESELVEVWVVHPLQIIGEAASCISNALREQYPAVAWGGMIGMRHVLVHGYFETDTEIVCKVAQNNLPMLKAQKKTSGYSRKSFCCFLTGT